MCSRFSSWIDVFFLTRLRAVAQIVPEEDDQSSNHPNVAEPLQRAFPQLYGPRDVGILRNAAVTFRLGGAVQYVDDAGSANARRSVHSGVRAIGMLAKLLRAPFGKKPHILLTAEVQPARRAGLDARRLEPFADAIRAQRTLENAMGLGVHLRNVKRASGDAIAAANAIGLLEIDDPIGVLHDGAVRGTRRQAAGLGAMHALVFAHQPHQRTVFLADVFVEEDEVPVIPARFRHRLVGVVENGFAEGKVVPLHAGDFASLAADAGRGVNELADGVFPLGAFARNGSGMAGDFLNA